MPPPIHLCISPQQHGVPDRDSMLRKCKQKGRRDESSGWEMGHSSLVGRGLNNFVPEINMLIRVALRNPHLLTSQALRQPHMPQAATPWQRRQGKCRAPWKGFPAWKPGSGRPWITLSGQCLKEGDLLYPGLKDPTDT